jgi:hypothetical protein
MRGDCQAARFPIFPLPNLRRVRWSLAKHLVAVEKLYLRNRAEASQFFRTRCNFCQFQIADC